MITIRPPGFNTAGTCSSNARSAPVSSFTSMRNAWNTCAKYLLGFPFTRSAMACLNPLTVRNPVLLRKVTIAPARVFALVTCPYSYPGLRRLSWKIHDRVHQTDDCSRPGLRVCHPQLLRYEAARTFEGAGNCAG